MTKDNESLAEEGRHQQEEAQSVYTKWEKYFITLMASYAALHSSISSPIYLPVIPVLLMQGLSPSIWCPLADTLGRRPVYLGCMVVYIGANIGLALSTTYAMLFVFRCLQSAGIASTVAIGAGVVGDVTSRKERGTYIGVWSGISLIGNAFGPLIGGGISSSLGWRAIFWFLMISSAVALILFALFMPETNRQLALDGSVIPSSFVNRSPYIYIRKHFKKVPKSINDSNERPPVDLMLSIRLFRFIDVVMLLIPASLHYTTWFMVITAQASLLGTEYKFSTLQTGLSYLASGLGGLLGSFTSGRAMTWYYRRQVAKFKAANPASSLGDFDIVRARLGVSWYPSLGLIIGSLIFGWTIEYHVHYIVPLLSTALVSFCSVFCVNLVQTLLVDLFPTESASSTACLNLARCLICAAGLAAVDSMTRHLGAGGAFTVMSGLCFVSWGLIYLELRIGFGLYRRRE